MLCTDRLPGYIRSMPCLENPDRSDRPIPAGICLLAACFPLHKQRRHRPPIWKWSADYPVFLQWFPTEKKEPYARVQFLSSPQRMYIRKYRQAPESRFVFFAPLLTPLKLISLSPILIGSRESKPPP